MIASRLPEYADQLGEPAVKEALSAERCEKDPVAAFEEGILIPLHELPAPKEGVRYLLIDALDESLAAGGGGGGGDSRKSIIGVLAGNIDRLPPWMRILATTRNETAVLSRLAGLRAHQLKATDPRNLGDIDTYVANRLQSPALAEKLVEAKTDAATVANVLREKGDGNFLYVVEVLRDIERRDESLAGLDDMPGGLTQLYIQFFDRLFQPDPDTKFAPVRHLLQVVAAARDPLTSGQIAAAAEMNAEEELPGWLRRLRQYLPARILDDSDEEPTYAIYHKSLADWLTSPDHLYHVSVRKGHERLAEMGGKEYRSGPDRMSAYGLRHTVRQAIEAERWDLVIGDDEQPGLLCDLRFIEAKCGAGLGYELSNDYSAAMEKLPELREEQEKDQETRQQCVDYANALAEYAGRCRDGGKRTAARAAGGTRALAGIEPGSRSCVGGGALRDSTLAIVI